MYIYTCFHFSQTGSIEEATLAIAEQQRKAIFELSKDEEDRVVTNGNKQKLESSMEEHEQTLLSDERRSDTSLSPNSTLRPGINDFQII